MNDFTSSQKGFSPHEKITPEEPQVNRCDTLIIEGWPDGGEVRVTLLTLEGDRYMSESSTASKSGASLIEYLDDGTHTDEWIEIIATLVIERCCQYDAGEEGFAKLVLDGSIQPFEFEDDEGE